MVGEAVVLAFQEQVGETALQPRAGSLPVTLISLLVLYTASGAFAQLKFSPWGWSAWGLFSFAASCAAIRSWAGWRVVLAGVLLGATTAIRIQALFAGVLMSLLLVAILRRRALWPLVMSGVLAAVVTPLWRTTDGATSRSGPPSLK